MAPVEEEHDCLPTCHAPNWKQSRKLPEDASSISSVDGGLSFTLIDEATSISFKNRWAMKWLKETMEEDAHGE
jgi:hypothetical protein